MTVPFTLSRILTSVITRRTVVDAPARRYRDYRSSRARAFHTLATYYDEIEKILD